MPRATAPPSITCTHPDSRGFGAVLRVPDDSELLGISILFVFANLSDDHTVSSRVPWLERPSGRRSAHAGTGSRTSRARIPHDRRRGGEFRKELRTGCRHVMRFRRRVAGELTEPSADRRAEPAARPDAELCGTSSSESADAARFGVEAEYHHWVVAGCSAERSITRTPAGGSKVKAAACGCRSTSPTPS